ncbi:MAG TPA: pilus assembly protein TadG-related protein [Lacipirellula sp.]
MAWHGYLNRIDGKHDRRGSALVLTAVCMVPLLGIVALAVDWGRICVAKAELQHAADAAALAGAWELLESHSPGYPATPSESGPEVRAAVSEYARSHTALGQSLGVQDADIQLGFSAHSSGAYDELNVSDPEQCNAVRVRVRRDEHSNGTIPMSFARVLGRKSADTAASATAMFIHNVAGFRPPADGENLPILPFALDTETWQAAVAGDGPDEWRWDPAREEFVRGSDGIPEFDLYPQPTGSAGNRGTVNIGTKSNSTSFISDQIAHGVSASDLEFHGGELKLDADSGLALSGDPGISAGFKDELSSILGEGRIIPVFTDVQGSGGAGVYTIREWAGIRLVEVELTGGDKRVIVQPAKVITGGAIPADPDAGVSSHYVFSRVWICR